MLQTNRIVTELPLTNIWTDDEELVSSKEKILNKKSLRDLLKQTQVDFVIADIGDKLKWIISEDCYDFWKTEVQDHIVDNPQEISFDDYKYLASQWTSRNNKPIVLLEKIH